jgi:hypothetical protein
MKYNVTNVSAHSEKGARSVFLTEAGKLLKAGESVTCNRIDNGTWGLEKSGLLKIEEGNFAQAPIFKDAPPVIAEDEKPTGPKPEDVAARRAEAEAMDKRLAAAKAAEEAKNPKPAEAPKPAEQPKAADSGKGKGKGKDQKSEEVKSDEGAKASAVSFSDPEGSSSKP